MLLFRISVHLHLLEPPMCQLWDSGSESQAPLCLAPQAPPDPRRGLPLSVPFRVFSLQQSNVPRQNPFRPCSPSHQSFPSSPPLEKAWFPEQIFQLCLSREDFLRMQAPPHDFLTKPQ